MNIFALKFSQRRDSEEDLNAEKNFPKYNNESIVSTIRHVQRFLNEFNQNEDNCHTGELSSSLAQ